MLEEVKNILNKAIKLNESDAFVFAVDGRMKELIISLNTHEQLGEDGIDSLGTSLGEYAPFTIQKKQSSGVGIGSITEHITFYDTGEYWKSWKVFVNKEEITITVDQNKFGELVGDLGFSPDHVGLTRENIAELTVKMLEKYQEYVRKKLAL